jgi:hypothetical protein
MKIWTVGSVWKAWTIRVLSLWAVLPSILYFRATLPHSWIFQPWLRVQWGQACPKTERKQPPYLPVLITSDVKPKRWVWYFWSNSHHQNWC